MSMSDTSSNGHLHNNNNMSNTQSIADYLAQLLKDKKQLAAFPNIFLHVERLLDEGKQQLEPAQTDDVISSPSSRRAVGESKPFSP